MPSSGRTDFRKHNRRGGSGLTEAERFWQKVDVQGPDECWLWLASTWGSDYGQFRRESGSRRAHVVAYELSVGPVPDGNDVHHKCEVKLCCNPGHLEAKQCHHQIGFCDGPQPEGDGRECLERF